LAFALIIGRSILKFRKRQKLNRNRAKIKSKGNKIIGRKIRRKIMIIFYL